MEREAANEAEQGNTAIKTYWLCLPDAHVSLQADERYQVIEQINQLIEIARRIRRSKDPNEKADLVKEYEKGKSKDPKEKADLVKEYEKRKNQLTEESHKLGNIVETYLDIEDRSPEERKPLRLMEASNNDIIHTF